MNVIRVDFISFVTTGGFGPFGVGTSWSTIVARLGEPPLYAPPEGSRPAFARYGILDFTIEDGHISVISLHLDRTALELPDSIQMTNFEAPNLTIDRAKALLDERGVTWERFEIMCDDRIDYFRTSKGVHLSFGHGRLGVIGVAPLEPGTTV